MRARPQPLPPGRLLYLLLLAGLAAPGRAQDAPTSATVTQAGRSLARAFEQWLRGDGKTPASKRNLCLLVDATPSLAAAGFADIFENALAKQAKTLAGIRLCLLRVGAPKAKPIGDRSLADLPGPLRAMLTKPKSTFRNVYADIRRAASLPAAGDASREILLLSLENGDAEDDLAATAKKLAQGGIRFSAICNEAYLSDSYWTARPYTAHPRKTKLSGQDGPFVDLPWGWLFQITVANEVAPSGHAFYGLSHLAAQTGGRIWIHTPKSSQAHACAVYTLCNFCSGDHVPEGETYWNARLERVAPQAVARALASSRLARDPFYRAVQKAWRAAAKAGVLRSLPPLRPGATSAEPPRPRAGRWVNFWSSLNFEGHARRADRAAAACKRILAELSADIARAAKTQAMPRQEAIAGFTACLLQLTRVNLVSFAAWCRDIAPGLVARKAPAYEPPEVDPVPRDRRPRGIGWTNLCLCHGPRPFLDIDLPGGEPLRTELRELATRYDAYFERFSNTPFAVALHRQGIARFSLTYPAQPLSRKRKRPKSKSETPPTTVTRSGRPARRGATGGGAAAGPTTGGRK